ncbi:DEAD/DEAH box helicase [Actinokineospora terrae]|nr:DEAD/DEAH box helicase [Actinokineospora terrae]
MVAAARTQLSRSGRLKSEGARQVASLVQAQVQAELAKRSVEDLRALVEGQVNLKALIKAGYTTADKVRPLGEADLMAVHGVGVQTATQVAKAVRVLADKVRRDTTIRFDPQRRDPGQTVLLSMIAALRHAVSTAPGLELRLGRLTERAGPITAAAKPTTRWWRFVFLGKKDKQAARDALDDVAEFLESPEVIAFGKELEYLRRATIAEWYQHDVWRLYTEDAASFNALLAVLGGQGGTDELEPAQGFLSEPARREVRATRLDVSRMKTRLRVYQHFGAQFAINRGRCILGDEMGLGKTVQALAALAHLAAAGKTRFLVVCPSSVLVNWLKEIEKHTTLTAHSLYGPDRHVVAANWLAVGGVGVATYDILRGFDLVVGAAVDMLVVDEAHKVKRPDSQRSQRIARMTASADRVLFMTGTPMENRVSEFRALIEYLKPEVAARLEPSTAVAGARAFRRGVASVYLRRNVEDVLVELPSKIEVEYWVDPNEGELEAYRDAVRSKNIAKMRQATFGPGSAKLERLVEIVDEARDDGRKVLVFSGYLDVIAVIVQELGDAVVGKLVGATPSRRRQELVDEFTRRDGHGVLVAQIDVGAHGLNIQAASVVVIAEPQWRPSVEEQAVARAYRMGQIGVVQVHRLLTKDSVDRRVRDIQDHKNRLIEEYVRKSDAKEADLRAVDAGEQRQIVELEHRRLFGEQHPSEA